MLIFLLLAFIPEIAFSAAKIIPGSVCKVYKGKVVYLDKTYTCINSGKKLVGSRGVVRI